MSFLWLGRAMRFSGSTSFGAGCVEKSLRGVAPNRKLWRIIEVMGGPHLEIARGLAAGAAVALPVSALGIAVLSSLAATNVRGGIGPPLGLLGWLFLGHIRDVYVGIATLAVLLFARWIVLFRMHRLNVSTVAEWMQIAVLGYGVSVVVFWGMLSTYVRVTS